MKSVYRNVKDAGGSVIAICGAYGEVARYEYDAWGKCKVLNPDGTENTSDTFVGNINPIRWKSQYYDAESGLYYMGGRYYSPETKQYLSPANPETAMANVATIYGLNLYLLTLTNPINMGYNGYTIATNAKLAFDPEELTWWDKFGTWVIAGALLLVATVAVPVLSGIFPELAFYIRYTYAATIGMSAIALGLGGVQAGFTSINNGNSFWQGFSSYITHNWAQTFIIGAITFIVIVGVGTTIAAIRNSGANKALASAPQTQTLDPSDIRFSQNSVNASKAQSIIDDMAKWVERRTY